jgi:peptide-methionine (S)-S-oxide reductase
MTNFFTRDIHEPADSLPGRDVSMPVPEAHHVLGTPLVEPFPPNLEKLILGLGCFWGAERKLWETPGVYTTAVGYAGGDTPNPTYEEVCSGRTGQNEVVLVVFDPQVVSLQQLFTLFWESHDPTQGMRQGNDIGTQYRSAIYTYSADQLAAALSSRDQYQANLSNAGMGKITTEIRSAGPFYYAEPYHQQYLAKNPGGYCAMGNTGVCYLPDQTA